MSRNTRYTKALAALEAAALVHGEAMAALREEESRIVEEHKARTGSDTGALVSAEAQLRLAPFRSAVKTTVNTLERTAVGLWKAKPAKKSSKVTT